MDTLKLIHVMNKEFPAKFLNNIWFKISPGFPIEDFHLMKTILDDEFIKIFENKKIKLKLHKDDRLHEIMSCFKKVDQVECNESVL